MATLSPRIAPASGVLFQELQGEAVLLELASGQYYGLNEIGTRIWQLLQSTGELDTVLKVLLEEYDVSEDLLREDLLRFTEILTFRGLLESHEP